LGKGHDLLNTVDASNSETVYVRTLGEFSLTVDSNRISDADGRTKKVWLLMEYLVTNRKKDLSLEQLTEAIWNDEEESDNPANALKNLVYRARTLLKGLSPSMASEYIVFSRNTYMWNRTIPCVVDVEDFERLCLLGSDVKREQDSRIRDYLEALELYKGEFLPKSSYSDWVISQSAYYASLYNKAVESVVELLDSRKRYDDIIRVCEAAAVICPFEESIHYSLLKALIASGQRRKAIAHYEYIADFFYKKLGVMLSNEVRGLYKEMTKGVEALKTDMANIEEDLQEAERPTGAFYCDYEIFKQMYRLQARSIARTGQSVHVALITVRDRDGDAPDIKLLKSAMNDLRDAALASLRKGDVVSAFSSAQLVLMLPLTTIENGEMVLRRITGNFYKHHKVRDCRIDTKLHEIRPTAY
jgi:DNA-binding SARP family transcriptional activator